VAAIIVHIDIDRGEARPFRQEVAGVDAVGQRGVPALQEGDGRRHGGQVTVELRIEGPKGLGAFALGHGLHAGLDGDQALAREQGQHQRQRQVFLHGIDPTRTQEARQVGGRGVRRVELRHRRDDGQHAQGLGRGHGRF